MDRISALNDEIAMLDDKKQDLGEEYEQKKEILENKLQAKYERREDLN